MSKPPSNTRRFINAAWSLLSFQLIAALGAVGVTGWAAMQAATQQPSFNGADRGAQIPPPPGPDGGAPSPVRPQEGAAQVAPFDTAPPAIAPQATAAAALCDRSGERFRIPANLEWCDTGLDLRQGDVITLREMTGGWTNQGEPNLRAGGYVGYRFQGTIVADADLAALVGKAGEAPFAIGASSSFSMPASGRLYFSINDTPGNFGDNQGALEFTLYVTRLE